METFVANSTINYTVIIEKLGEELRQRLLNLSLNDTDTKTYEVPAGIVVVLAILYGSISILSITGNSLVILVIAKDKRMQTVTNIFIANLATADIFLGMFTTPFQFQPALHQRWDFPHILCNLAPFFKVLSVTVSVFTLTIISMDRYVAVIYPLKAGFSKSYAILSLVFIWLVGFGSSFPEGYFFSVKMTTDKEHPEGVLFCSPAWPSENFSKYYYCYLTTVQYLLPLCIILFAYMRIACRIWGTDAPGNSIDNRDNARQRTKKKVSIGIIKFLILKKKL